MDVTNRPNNPPSFLGIPREIRNEIYSYFLVANDVFDAVVGEEFFGQVGINFHDIYRFRVNREEGEGYDLAAEVEVGYGRLGFPSHHLPVEYESRLASEVGITFRLHENEDEQLRDIGNKNRTSMLFAYHPIAYANLVWGLHLDTPSYKVLYTHVNPVVMSCHRRFEKLIKPLVPIRGFAKARFTGVEGYPMLQMLASMMECRFPREVQGVKTDNTEVLKRLHFSLAHDAERAGRFSDAMCQFWLGFIRSPPISLYYDVGTDEYNYWEEMRARFYVGFIRCIHKYMTYLKKRFGIGDISASHVRYIIRIGMELGCEALGRISPTMYKQRGDAHLYLAFIHIHKAEHDIAMSHGSGIIQVEDKVGGLYLNASRHAYYAAQMAKSLSDNSQVALNEDDRTMYGRIWQRPGPQAFNMAGYSRAEWSGSNKYW